MDNKFTVRLSDNTEKIVTGNTSIAYTVIKKLMTAVLAGTLVSLDETESRVLPELAKSTILSGGYTHGKINRVLTAKIEGKVLTDFAKIKLPVLPITETGKKTLATKASKTLW